MFEQEKKIEASRAGAVLATTQIMGRKEFRPETRASAGKVLGSIAQIRQGRSMLQKAKSVPVLTQSCLDEDPAVRGVQISDLQCVFARGHLNGTGTASGENGCKHGTVSHDLVP
mgnify:FL=1